MSEAPVQKCCLTGFRWNGTPTGRIGQLANNQAYIAGDDPDTAVLLIHDLPSWKFDNIRLLADHYAAEIGATVYLPDFFGGKSLNIDAVLDEDRWGEIDIAGFMKNNTRTIREPEIFECARALKQKYRKVGAVGYCFGGWAVFRLAAEKLVDCVSAGHPTFLTKEDIDGAVGCGVPVQVLAPEFDAVFTKELKMYCFEKMSEAKGAFEYRHFPGVVHACFTRGNEKKEGERDAMVRGKGAFVGWAREWLKVEE